MEEDDLRRINSYSKYIKYEENEERIDRGHEDWRERERKQHVRETT